jgi:hypothetical protein
MSTKYKIPDEQLSLFTSNTPSMPVFDTSRCQARIINYETAARMVETYHYAHRVPSIVVAIGMYVDDILAGCITYGIPPNRNILTCCGNKYVNNALELNRLFLFDWTGKNSESWLIGQSFKLIPNSYFILVSYADTEYSHLGYVYQATNWIYTGKSERGGWQADAIVNNIKMSPKDVWNKYRTLDVRKLEKMGLTVKKLNWFSKHRYVYFLGSKTQRKKLRKALRWSVLPYPK